MAHLKAERNKGKNFSKRIYSLLLAVFCLMFVISGCGKDARETEIEQLSKKYSVPKEKQLVICTSHKEEVYLPIIREFEVRTGIWVEIRTGGTAEMMDKIESGLENGECDIMFGGGAESYEARKELFVPYSTSENENLNQAYLSQENLWTPFTELPIVFVYNPKLVSVTDAPKSWHDLFLSKWKGLIAFADMEVSGTSYTIISTMEQLFDEGPESLIPRFYEQLNGNILASSGDILPSVESGKYLVGITLEETAKKYIESGHDIAMIYPSDGTCAIPDACAIVKNAPHSYNAGKFIDFIVSQDTQKFAMEEFHRRPVRTDVELLSEYGRIDLMDFDIKKSASEEKEAMKIWREITKQEGN
ncbi:ABC-type Fe3+ transport system, periplasmic component [Lachnospiraceae bacterium JC7]|nr:ABC-type Fe3+ transport system, periplasmic component [Lachnospiraceae bacterium JC7]